MRITKSRGVKRAGHVAHIKNNKEFREGFVGKSKVKVKLSLCLTN
jgi:hypothetical protein